MITHFGLDIGSDTIKIAQVVREGNFFRLVTAGMIKAPPGGMVSDADKDLVAIAEAIKKLKSEIRISTNEVITALPERSVFSQIIEVPKMNEEELNQAIPWEAENIIPQPLSEVNLDWEIIEDEESSRANKVKVFLVAAPTTLVSKYLKVLKLADLEPLALETELLAITRCLGPALKGGSLLLANIGSKSLDIALIRQGSLFLTRRLPTAGEAISRALSTSLNLDLNTAEEYKKTYGFSKQLENKVAAAIEPVMVVVNDEIKKAIHFYEEKAQTPMRLMVLTGGTALLPGIAEYFAQSLGLEVQIADPFSLVKIDEKSQALLKKSSPFFTVALGLAMKES